MSDQPDELLNENNLNSHLERFKKICQESGLRITHQRLEVYQEVVNTPEHPDVEHVFKRIRKRLPTISLDTVYRTLTTLEDHGIICRVDPTAGRIRFDANPKNHHHFICTQCGKIQDIYLKPDECLSSPEEAKHAGIIETLHLQVRGVCNQCLSENEEA